MCGGVVFDFADCAVGVDLAGGPELHVHSDGARLQGIVREGADVA